MNAESILETKLCGKGKEPTTGLWVLPISTNSETSIQDRKDDDITKLQNGTKEHMAENAYSMTSKESLINYLHQCLFSPTKKALVKSIENNQLTTWPGLTSDAVRKHPPDSSPATDKGHMKKPTQRNPVYDEYPTNQNKK